MATAVGAGGTKSEPWNPLPETLAVALNSSATVILGHGVHGAIESLETARSMAHALAEALPDDPEDRADPERSVNSRAARSTPGGKSRC